MKQKTIVNTTCGSKKRGKAEGKVIGNKFGSLTVQHLIGRNANRQYVWMCICDCGGASNVTTHYLTSGRKVDCGCGNSGRLREASTRHGHCANKKLSPEYVCWISMRARCRDEKNEGYSGYGAKGILVCDRWYDSFELFLEDVGRRPSKLHTLDRFPNKEGNYEPGNVRWADKKQQARNRKNNVIIEIDGVSKCFSEWCEIYGIAPESARCRIRNGWPLDRLLFSPMDKKRRKNKVC